MKSCRSMWVDMRRFIEFWPGVEVLGRFTTHAVQGISCLTPFMCDPIYVTPFMHLCAIGGWLSAAPLAARRNNHATELAPDAKHRCQLPRTSHHRLESVMAHRVLHRPTCHRDFGGVRQNDATNDKGSHCTLQTTTRAVPHLNAITGAVMDKNFRPNYM